MKKRRTYFKISAVTFKDSTVISTNTSQNAIKYPNKTKYYFTLETYTSITLDSECQLH
jgi:hypothetical protein